MANYRNDIFAEELGNMDDAMDAVRTFMLLNRINLVANKIINRVTNRHDDIIRMMASKASAKEIRAFITSEISLAFGDDITVNSYNQRARAHQTVSIYTGEHWVVLCDQQFTDLVKGCAKALGVEEVCYEDPTYMNPISEALAYRKAVTRLPYTNKEKVLLNVQNGTLEISEKHGVVFRSHNRDDNFAYVLPFCYQKDATCEQWIKFLDEVIPEKDKQVILAEFLAYCFCRGMRAEKLLVLHGVGSNGKSVVLKIIEALFGKENLSFVSLGDLTLNDEKRSMMEGKLANISSENDKKLNPGVLKQLISGDEIDVRQLYKGSHATSNYGRLIASYNIMPPAEQTHGFFRRFLIIEFNKIIPVEKQDWYLAEKLLVELPGILNWVLDAMKGLVARGRFSESESCKEALENYIKQSNSALLFIAEECEKNQVWTYGKEIFRAYKTYCYEYNLELIGRNSFFDILEGQGIKKDYKNNVPTFNLKLCNGENYR